MDERPTRRDALPKPPGWPASRKRPSWQGIAATVFLGSVALLLGRVTLDGVVLRGLNGFDTRAALYFSLLLPLLPFVLPVLVPFRRDRPASRIRARMVDDIDQRGVVLPYSTWQARSFLVSLVAAVVLCGGLAAISVAVGIPDGGLDVWSAIVFALTLLLLGYLVGCLIEIVRGGLAPGFVALTPLGLYHRSFATACYVPWQDVAEVDVVASTYSPIVQVKAFRNTSGWHRRTSRFLGHPAVASAPHLTVAVELLETDPALFYHAARYYHADPAARPELGDERGLARLREGRVLAGCD